MSVSKGKFFAYLVSITLFFLLFSTFSQGLAAPLAPSLLILKSVSNATPAPGETFIFTIQYRCASATEHCENAQIVDTVPSALTIVNTSPASGNVTAVDVTGNTVTFSLASPDSDPAPDGVLAAGSTGLVRITARFPACDNTGTVASSVSNSADFQTSNAGTITSNSVTVDATPTLTTCPAAPPPLPPATDISKTLHNYVSGGVAPGAFVSGNIVYPSKPSSYVITDTVPAGLEMIDFRLSSTVSIDCGGGFISGPGGEGRLIDFVDNVIDNGAAGPPYALGSGCFASEMVPGVPAAGYVVNVQTIRTTVAANASGSGVWVGRVADTASTSATLQNCISANYESPDATACVDIPLTDYHAEGLPYKDIAYDPTRAISSNNPNPTVFALAGVTYDSSATPPQTPRADEIWYALELVNRKGGNQDIVDPVIVDLLPAELEFVEDPVDGNWWMITSHLFDEPMDEPLPPPYNMDTPACQNPTFTHTPDYNGTGRTLLRWEFIGCTIHADVLVNDNQNIAPSIAVIFSTRIREGVVAGTTIRNVVTGFSSAGQNNWLCPNGVTDTNDLDGDGDTTELACSRNAIRNIVVPALADLNSSKWVQGALDTGISRFPQFGDTNLAGEGSYELYIDNTGNVEYTSLDIVDILPYIGDTEVLNPSVARNSEWSEEIAGALVIERYDDATDTWSVVPTGELTGPFYSTSIDPCRATDDIVGALDGVTITEVDADEPSATCDANPWTTASATPDTNDGTAAARSFGLRWSPGATTPFAPGERLRVTVPVRQLTGEADALPGTHDLDGDGYAVAWNSFGYSAVFGDPDISNPPDLTNPAHLTTLPSSEPLKVGLKMVDVTTTYSVGNELWCDNDGDGVRQGTESGVPFATVRLYDSTGATLIETTATDANGEYGFVGLTPSTTYLVRVDNSADYALYGALHNAAITPNGQGGDPTLDSDGTVGADGFAEATLITGTAGTATVDLDFGFICTTASLGDYVWYDTDGFGDQGEPFGVQGAQVTLWSAGVNAEIGGGDDVQILAGADGVYGSADDSATPFTTGANGAYLFTGLPVGNYYVIFDISGITGTDPLTGSGVNSADWTFTVANSTGDEITDSDANPQGITELVYLNAGDDYRDLDAGLQPTPTPASPVSIGNFVWEDTTNNNQQDVGEPGIAGVRVDLLDTNGFPIATTFTDGTGYYQFDNLEDGATYELLFTPPAGYTFVNANDGTDDTDDSDADPVSGSTGTFTVSPSAAQAAGDPDATATLDSRWDAGLVGTLSLGNLVWHDLNQNSLYDSGEPGLSGLEVRLLDSVGATTGITTTTDANGKYLFTGLSPAQYMIEVENPSGLVSSNNIVSSTNPDNGTDSDDNGTDGTTTAGYTRSPLITLEFGGGDLSEADHGVAINSVTDTTANRNADYTLDMSFVSITASNTNPAVCEGNLLPNDSFENGTFSGGTAFAGGFQLSVPLATGGVTPIDWNQDTGNGDVTWINSSQAYSGTKYIYTFSSGTTADSTDACMSPDVNVSLESNTTYQLCAWAADANADGNASGLAFEVDEDGAPFHFTTVTLPDNPAWDDNAATTIPWQQYCYTFTTGGGTGSADIWVSASAAVGGATSYVAFDNVCLAPVETLGAIGNTIWIDENSDGYQDVGEDGLANVTVNLYNSAGSLVGTTVTDSHGNYLFDELPAGDYYVDVDETTLPAGMSQTTTYPQPNGDFTNQDHSTTAIPSTALTGYPVSIGNGQPLENLTADFGYNYVPTVNTVGECFNALTNAGFEQFGAGVSFTPTPLADFNGDSLQAYAWAENDTNIASWMPTLTGNGSHPTAFLIDDTAGNINNPEGDYFAYLPGGVGSFECVEQSIDVFLSAGLTPGEQYQMCYMAAAGTQSGAIAHIEYAQGTSYASLHNQALPQSSSSTNLDWQEVCHTFTFDPAFMDRIVISQQGTGGMSIDAMQLCEVGSTTGGQGNGAIGDRIWVDTDGDGAQDPNEAGVFGVEVTLYHDPDGDGVYDTVYGTTTTDANGNYIFTNLPPAAYVVTVTNDAGASHPVLGADYNQTGDPDHFGTSGINNDNTTTTPIVLAPGDVFLNADFGYQPQGGATVGSIGDTIFFDADGDGNGPALAPVDGGGAVTQGAGGVADATDYGIIGVTVALIYDINGNGEWDASEPIVATDTTDANGQYLFEGLAYTDYIVWVNDTDNVLSGLTATYDNDGANPTAGLETGLGISATTIDAGNINDRDQDFGYGADDGTGLIGDTIFLNINGDGDQDADEPGLEGVIVILTDSNGITTTATTDENGHYYFGGLNPTGTYTVTVAPENFASGGVLEGLSNTVDPNGGNDNTSVVDLSASGGIDLDQDYGYTPASAASIGNLVWLDVDADGVYDGGVEIPIGGVTIDLYRDLNGNGRIDAGEPLFGTTTTDAAINVGSYGADGNYLFAGLPAGDYVVDVTDVDGVLAGYWHSLGTAATDNNSQLDPYGVSVAAGETNLTADFGYYLDPACIGNFVWDDSANSNGIQDAGEAGIDGVTMTLTITYPSGDVTVLTTVTGDDPSTTGVTEQGWYSFCNLLQDESHRTGSGTAAPASGAPGFELSAELPPNLIPTIIDATATNDQADSENPAGAPATPIQGALDTTQNSDPTSEGNPAASYDFGATNAVNIGNYIWFEDDSDGDATTGAVTDASGVVVSLTDANGTVITTTTDSSGLYTFTVPANATYTVTVATPAGYTPSTVLVSGTDSDPATGDNQNHNSAGAVVQVSTVDNLTIDFAFNAVPSYAIGNFVWIDGEATGNGMYNDGTDTPAGDVTMQLYRVVSGTVAETPLLTTTTVAGAYQFTGVEAGVYVVCIPSEEFTPSGDLWNNVDGAQYGVVGANANSTGAGDDSTDHNTVYVANPGLSGVCSNHVTLGDTEPTGENAHGLATGLDDTAVDWTVDFAFAPLDATAVNLLDTGIVDSPITPLLLSLGLTILLLVYFVWQDKKRTDLAG